MSNRPDVIISQASHNGLLDEIGKQRFYDTNRAAIAAFRWEWS